jgi:signal transduction histidine kinase
VLAEEKGAPLSLAGWLLCASASVHDILMENGILHGINLIPYAFLAFFLCLSGMLAARYRDAFRQAKNMSARLQSLNEELELAVQERTSELNEKLFEISSSQAELQRAKEEAVSANIAKSRFLATMSHELRTPLNSILGFSEIIRDAKLGNLGDERYGEYAAYINESGAHLLSLIGDILDLSRIESGRLDLQFERVNVADVVEDALAKAATRAQLGRERVSATIPQNLPDLHADRRALMQMIINLVSNALKFTPEGGKIVLSALERHDGGITLQVEDHGIGMTEAEIPKALKPFTQVDDNLSRRSEGSGLGLAIVKSLVEHHEGNISISSEKGVGTTVRLEFPRERSVSTRSAAALAG